MTSLRDPDSDPSLYRLKAESRFIFASDPFILLLLFGRPVVAARLNLVDDADDTFSRPFYPIPRSRYETVMRPTACHLSFIAQRECRCYRLRVSSVVICTLDPLF